MQHLFGGMVNQHMQMLSRPRPTALDLRKGIVLTGTMEQMFFFGSLLAHVVAYEEWQCEQHRWQSYRRQARRARHGGPALPPEPRPRA